MWWNEAKRRWERHPMCTCEHDPCYCRNLPMLDAHGKPIGQYGVLGPPKLRPANLDRSRYCEHLNDIKTCPVCAQRQAKKAS